MLSLIAVPSCAMRSASHAGTRPPCKGRSATPERLTSLWSQVWRAGVASWCAAPRGSCLFAVLFDGAIDCRTGFGQILRVHDRPEPDLRVESEEPRFGYGRNFRGILHVKDDCAGALAFIVGEEIGSFGLKIGQNLLDRGSQSASLGGGISR